MSEQTASVKKLNLSVQRRMAKVKVQTFQIYVVNSNLLSKNVSFFSLELPTCKKTHQCSFAPQKFLSQILMQFHVNLKRKKVTFLNFPPPKSVLVTGCIQVQSNEIDLAESNVHRQILIKERGAGIFSKFCSFFL